MDGEVVNEIFLDRTYATDYRGGVVIDGGAHRGYYGAFALLSGAAAVVSVEPERRNLGYLGRAAATFRRHGRDWRIIRAAIGARFGETTLYVTERPWAHSLRPEAKGKVVDTQLVSVRPLPHIVDEARNDWPHRPLVVKLDVEGSECEIVLGTPMDTWTRVDEVFLEFEDMEGCTETELLRWLEGARLHPTERARNVLHLVRS